jgi:cytochrome c556
MLALVGYITSLFILAPAAIADDTREKIELPSLVQEKFLIEMRGNLMKLEDIMGALAKGDFKEVANIADLKMGFGHGQMEQMEKMGKSTEEMLSRKNQMRKIGMPHGGGQGRGMGRYMPENFRAMGQNLHQASEDLAEKARSVGTSPSVKDYQAVISSLEDVSNACTSCHQAFRVR